MFNKEVHFFSTVASIKILVIVPLLSVFGYCSFAEECYTTSDTTWSCGAPNSTDKLIVRHQVVIDGNFRTTAGIIIENNGVLKITGDFFGNDCNVIVKNEGSFIVSGNANIEEQCKITVEGELKVAKNLSVKSNAVVQIYGTGEIEGSTLLYANSTFKLKQQSTLLVNKYFTNNSDATEIDGDLTIELGLVNVNLITGVGQISFNSCLSTGLINDLRPEDYCSSSPLNLLASHCSSTDNEAPVFVSFPEDLIAYTTQNSCEENIYWNFPTATDNCSLDDIFGSHDSGDLFPLGSTTVIYSAKDKAGNETSRKFTVSVKDTIAPSIKNVPADILLGGEPDGCGAVALWDEPIAIDNCSATLTSDHKSGDFFPIGTTTVRYTATDPSGNKSLASFQIQIKNPNPPSFTSCPSDTILYVGGDNCEMAISWIEPELVGCSLELTQTHQPGDLFTTGVHLVKYTATDFSSIEASCEFMIQVIDTIAPDFVFCPTEYEVQSMDTLAEKAVISWMQPEAIDNCNTVSLKSTHLPGEKFDFGVTEVIYIAADEFGNESMCTFELDVFINSAPEIEPQHLFSNAGETLHICMDASDPDGDITSLKSIEYTASRASISEIDSADLCFSYTSVLDFDGIDTLKVHIIDNGVLPLKSYAIVIVEVMGDRTIKVSSAITANEDDINDKWIIDNITFYPNNSVHVFDPYGGLIFESTGYNNEEIVWTGKNTAGNYVPTGTYFFAIDPGNNQKKITGAVEVIR